MTSEEIKDLQRARENLIRRRSALAKQMASVDLPPVVSGAELTTVQAAIEAIDRALSGVGAVRDVKRPAEQQ
jgi:hypothetical protein